MKMSSLSVIQKVAIELLFLRWFVVAGGGGVVEVLTCPKDLETKGDHFWGHDSKRIKLGKQFWSNAPDPLLCLRVGP